MAFTIISAMPWPSPLLLRERSLQWIPDYGHEASPPALDGTRQFGSNNGGGLWRCTLSGVQLRRPEHVKAWLAFEVGLRGGMTPLDVPLFLKGYQPNSTVAATNGGWPARAISGRVTVSGEPIEPGQHFSDYDSSVYGWRLHRIETAEESSGNLVNITFWPPARFAVADSHALEITSPRCVMRLAGSGSTDLDLEYRKRGDPDASFVEAGG